MSTRLIKKQVAGTAGSAVGTTAGGASGGSYNDGSYHGVGAQGGQAASAGTGASTGAASGSQAGAGTGAGTAAGGTSGGTTGGTTGSTAGGTTGSSGSSSKAGTSDSSSSSSDTKAPTDSSKAPVTAGSTNSGVKEEPADDPPADEEDTPDDEVEIPEDDEPSETEKDTSKSITDSIVHSMSSSSQSASPTATPSMSASKEEKDEDDNKGLKIALPIILGLLFILFMIWVGKRVVKKRLGGKKNKPTNITFNDHGKSQETFDEKSPLPPPGFQGAGAPLLDRRGSMHSGYSGAPPLMHANSSASHSDYLSAYHQNMSTHSFNNLGGQRRQPSPVPPYGQHPYNGMMSRSMSTNSYQNGPPPQPQRPGPPISSPPSAPHLPALAIPDPELIPLPSPPPSVYSLSQIPTSPPRPEQQFRDPFRDPPARQLSTMSRASNVPPLHIRPPGAVRARVSFKPTATDELTILKGEDVQVIRRFSDGWAEVKALASGRTGVIPLQILDDQPTTPMSYGSQSSNSPTYHQAPAQSMSQPQGFPSAPPSNFQ